jgi:hypothetical protein
MTSWCRRRARAVLAACAVLAFAGPASAGSLFSAVDDAQLVVRAKVEGSTPYPKAKLTVFHLRVTRALKGPAAAGERLELAQEMLFATTKPLFADGTETLVLAVPLQSYTSFQDVLPDGTYWRWSDRLATAPALVPLADPALADVVGAYLAAAGDPDALATFLVRMIVGTHPRVRQDALLDVARRRDVVPLLDTGRLAPVDAWLRDDTEPTVERARTIVALARAGAVGVLPAAERLAAAEGPLQAPAIDALITLNRPPTVDRLVAFSRKPDEAIRLVAGRGLALAATPPALDRLEEMLSREPSKDVRIAVLQAFGRTPNARIVELVARELARADRAVSGPAAEALVRQDSPEAIAALRTALESGQEDARVAAAFALKRVNRREADEILEEIEATHPDPAVRRLCKLALGESMHEH